MDMTRRGFLKGTAAGVAGARLGVEMLPAEEAASKKAPQIRLSACDWSLGAGGPGGLEIAKRCTLEGLEVSAGGAADKLKIADADYRKQYKEKVKETGILVPSLAMGLLNGSPLATEPRGPAWLEQTIEAAADLGAGVILVAFFGKGSLLSGKDFKKDDVEAVVTRLKDAAVKAKEAKVILGLENTLSAKQNLEIIDRVKSDWVRVYYDIGNSTGGGYNVPEEIRTLKERMAMIHFKDGGSYLGEGKVKMEPVAEALHAIEYKGWIVLETSCPSKDRDADFKKNAAYVRKLMGV